jgi:hypothetical protein
MKYFLILITSLLSISCSNNKITTFHLLNLKNDTALSFLASSKHPTNLEISIKGNSNDSICVDYFILPSGPIDTVLKRDHYNEKVNFNVRKFKSSDCNLILNCKAY